MVTLETKSRTQWVDIAKAFAIILVVLYHSALFMVFDGLSPDYWNRINGLFATFRMPLFFFASGLFAASVIARTWSKLWQSRLALLVWTYLLWTVIRFGFFWVVPSPLPLDENNPVLLLIAPVWPQTGLWFLHALALFFVVAKIIHRVPPAVQVGVAAVVSGAFFAGASVGNISYNGMLQYFVFFLAACHYRVLITQAVERLPRWGFVVPVAAFGLLAVAVQALSIEGVYGAKLAVAVVAVAAGLMLARGVEAAPGATTLAWIGKNTLPIYVSHVLIVAAITFGLSRIRDTAPVVALAPALPVLVATVALALALALWRVLTATRAGSFLYSPPVWFSRISSPRASSDAPRHRSQGQ